MTKVLAKLTSTQRSIIAFLLIILVADICWRCIVSPQMKAARAIRTELLALESLLEWRQHMKERLPGKEEELQGLEVRLHDLRELAFTKEEVTRFFEGLDAKAKLANVELISMNPVGSDRVPGMSGPGFLPRDLSLTAVEVAVRGNYRNLIAFFKIFEEEKRLLSVSMSRISTDGDEPELRRLQLLLACCVKEGKER